MPLGVDPVLKLKLIRDHPLGLSRGLLAAYSFGQGFGDLTGNGSDGTLGNSPSLVSGLPGPNLAFVGSSAQVVSCPVPPATVGSTSPFTVAGWVYRAALGQHGGFFQLGNVTHPTTGGDGFMLGIGAAGSFETSGDLYGVLANGVRWGFAATVGTGWHFFGFTLAGSAYEMYWDGVGVTGSSGVAIAGVGSLGTPVMQIGGAMISAGPTNRCFTGSVASVLLYNQALSAAEMAALYSDSLCMFEPVRRRARGLVSGATIYTG